MHITPFYSSNQFVKILRNAHTITVVVADLLAVMVAVVLRRQAHPAALAGTSSPNFPINSDYSAASIAFAVPTMLTHPVNHRHHHHPNYQR